MLETWDRWVLSKEDPLQKGMATRSSVLAWRTPWTEEPGRLQSMRLQESDMSERLSTGLLSQHATRWISELSQLIYHGLFLFTDIPTTAPWHPPICSLFPRSFFHVDFSEFTYK